MKNIVKKSLIDINGQTYWSIFYTNGHYEQIPVTFEENKLDADGNITNEHFNEMVDALLHQYERELGSTLGRQAKATKRGLLLEQVAHDLLINHPNVDNIESQVFCSEIDEFSSIDLVIRTKTGKKVYVPVARDLWLGTSQTDRLQIQAAKFTGGILSRHNYCYLVGDCFANFLGETCATGSRKKVTVQKWVKKLSDNKMLFTFNGLYRHLRTL